MTSIEPTKPVVAPVSPAVVASAAAEAAPAKVGPKMNSAPASAVDSAAVVVTKPAQSEGISINKLEKIIDTPVIGPVIALAILAKETAFGGGLNAFDPKPKAPSTGPLAFVGHCLLVPVYFVGFGIAGLIARASSK